MILKSHVKNKIIFVLIWGIVGGLALILGSNLTTSGWLEIIPYPIILLFAIYWLAKTNKNRISYTHMFKTSLSIFMLMSLVLYAYISLFINPNSGIDALGHLWRLGAILGFGVASSLIVSLIVKSTTKLKLNSI